MARPRRSAPTGGRLRRGSSRIGKKRRSGGEQRTLFYRQLNRHLRWRFCFSGTSPPPFEDHLWWGCCVDRRRLGLNRRDWLRRIGKKSHSGGICRLDQFGIFRGQAVLSLQDRYRPRLSFRLALDGLDLLDQLSTDRGELFNAKLFPDGCGGRTSSSDLGWAATGGDSIRQAGGGWLVAVQLIPGEIRRVQIVLPGNPDHREERVAPGIGQGRPHSAGRGRLRKRADRPIRGDPLP